MNDTFDDDLAPAFRIYDSADYFRVRRPKAEATSSLVASPPLEVSIAPRVVADANGGASCEANTEAHDDAHDDAHGDDALGAHGVVEPPAPTTIEVAVPREVESRLVDILGSSRAACETIEVAYKRKEHEIAAVFGGLSSLEARALNHRLTRPRQGDVLALQFGRLIEARRARLLSVLTDTRRREAQMAHR